MSSSATVGSVPYETLRQIAVCAVALFEELDVALSPSWREETLNVEGGDGVNRAWTELAAALDLLKRDLV